MYKTVLRIEKSLYGATVNAQKFETAFYSNPDLRAVKPPESPESVLELDHLIEQLRRSPGLKKTVSQLIAANEFN